MNMKTTIKRDKDGNIVEIMEDGEIEEYLAFDKEVEG